MSFLYELKPSDLISPRYVQLQRELHASPRGYGQRGSKWAEVVADLVHEYDAASLLDYGCGQGSLVSAVQTLVPKWVRVEEYDPAIAGKDSWPHFADLVVCTDVLEHVEPDRLQMVLRHLRTLARKAVFVVVSIVETAKVLSDGRNAHLTIEDGIWWRARLEAVGFQIKPPPDSARSKPDKEWIAVLRP